MKDTATPGPKSRRASFLRMGDVFSILDTWRVVRARMVRNVGELRQTLDPNYQFLRFLMSPLNRNAGMFSTTEIQRGLNQDGKRYIVRRRFLPTKASGVHTGYSRNYCGNVGDATDSPYVEDSIELGYSHVSRPLTLDQCQLLEIPESRDQWINDRMFTELMRTFENDLAVKVAKRLVTGGFIGTHANGDASVDIPLFLQNGKSINPTGEVLINELMLQAQTTETPALIGGTLLSKYPSVSNYTSANQLGWDASLQAQRSAVWRDVAISRLLGDDDKVIMAIPGALQLYTRNRHRGDFADPTDPYVQRATMVSPFTGIEYDVILRKACSDSGDILWSFQLALDWDLVGIPKCWTEDPCLIGITDVYVGKIICSDMGVCDIPKFDGCIDPALLDLDPANLIGCVGAVECSVACQARLSLTKYASVCKFAITASNLSAAKVYGVSINGMDFAFTGYADDGYQMNSTGNIAAVAAQLQAALGSNGTVDKALYTGGGTLTDFIVFANCGLLEIKFLVAAGADVEFTRDTTSGVRVRSLSTPTTGATLTNLAYAFTLGSTPAFNGAPGAAITGVSGVTGNTNSFFIEPGGAVADGAVLTHTITDSVACTNAVTDTVDL